MSAKVKKQIGWPNFYKICVRKRESKHTCVSRSTPKSTRVSTYALTKREILRCESNLVSWCVVIFEQNDFLFSSLYLSVFSKYFTLSIYNFCNNTIKLFPFKIMTTVRSLSEFSNVITFNTKFWLKSSWYGG